MTSRGIDMTQKFKALEINEKELKKAKNSEEFHKLLIKRSCLILAKEHKEKCDTPSCGVNILHLYELLKEAKIKLSKEDIKVFL